MKKIIAIFLILDLIIVLTSCQFITNNTGDFDYPKYIDSISEYNTTEYPVKSPVFVDVIPENAEVVSYYYYNYWNEQTDRYLELTFEDQNAMEVYLQTLFAHATVYESDILRKFDDCFIEEKNPYDDSYIDCFYIIYSVEVNNRCVTGYSINNDDGREIFAYYNIISYSLENLTIIQTSTNGLYRDKIQSYIPKYLMRFSVQTESNFERYCYFKG